MRENFSNISELSSKMMKGHSLCFVLLFLVSIMGEKNKPQNNIKKYSSISVTDQEIDQLFDQVDKDIEDRRKQENYVIQKGKVVTSKQKISDSSLNRDRKTDPKIHRNEYVQMPFEFVTKKLDEKYHFSDNDICNNLPRRVLRGSRAQREQEECNTTISENIQCDPLSKYRTMDGTCNNLENPRWGSASTCFQRLNYAHYEGVDGFRQSVYGGPLPEPRQLSLNIHNNIDRPTNYVNHLFMFFGQLLDHDITLTPTSTTSNNEAPQCCPQDDANHPQCAPIDIPNDDPFYSQFGVTCLNFVRSAICPSCRLGRRDQINSITAFIDASFIYGNDENTSISLRTNDGTGKLRFTETPFGNILAQSSDPENDQCSRPEEGQICFESGDSRVNQHTTLTSLHTIFLREHNRIAEALRKINPRWNDETLFQEARRIVGAEMQMITYNEYLPITLGEVQQSFYNLRVSNRRRTSYNSRKNPTLYTEFSTAAFRFGHSLINSLIANHNLNETFGIQYLRNDFFEPFNLYNGVISPLLRGVSRSSAQFFDRHVTSDVTNYLYRTRGDQTGLDLASINIQRGRDHGLPPYTEMVNFCTGGEFYINSFSDLFALEITSPENARLLLQNYRSVHDIDLWTGILSEFYISGAVVGPTASCIIGRQFQNLKFGDRFYFEHRNQRGSFTYEQLSEIRKMSLAKIICLNTDINEMPRRAMLFRSSFNFMIECKKVRGLNLRLWREDHLQY